MITGIPSGRWPPLALGIYTRLTGKGSHDAVVWCTRVASSILAAGVSATSPSIPAVMRPALRCVTCWTLTSVFDQERSVIFCRERALGQSPSRTALKILLRSLPTSSSRACQFMAAQVRAASSGPFTIGAQLALRLGKAYQPRSSIATCSRQRPFGPGHEAGIRPVIHGSRWRSSHPPWFPAAFRRTGIRFLSILFPPAHRLPLRSAYQASDLDPDGVSTFRTSEIRPGWAPSKPRGRWCSRDRLAIPGRHLPHPSGVALSPRSCSRPPRGLVHEASSRVHSRSPVRSSPHL